MLNVQAMVRMNRWHHARLSSPARHGRMAPHRDLPGHLEADEIFRSEGKQGGCSQSEVCRIVMVMNAA